MSTDNKPIRFDAYVCAALTGLLANPDRLKQTIQTAGHHAKSPVTLLVQEAVDYANALEMLMQEKEKRAR